MKFEISREELNKLPLGSFDGEVKIIKEAGKIPEVIRDLRKSEFVGFDTETRPSFFKGQKFPVSLIQLATDKKVFLIRNRYTGWPAPLVKFFANPSILKVGVGIRDDLKAIRSEIRGAWEPEGFVELNNLVREVGIISQGMRKLTALILGFRISKAAQTSNWEKETLDEKQIRYAATDAWCCHQIYKELLVRGYLE